jgi:hypothetical protein
MTRRGTSKPSAPWRCVRCSQPVELRHAVKHYADECPERQRDWVGAADTRSTGGAR